MEYEKFLKSLDPEQAVVCFDEEMKFHTSFGIGGKVKYFVVVNKTKTLIEILKRTNKFFILGAGTNLLFQDKIYDGTIIKLGKEFNRFKINENTITVGSGVNLFYLCKILKENGLLGMEFLFGIPGTVGGGIVSNAGAFGKEVANYVKKVKIFDGKRVYWTKNFNFEYRNSSFKKNRQIVLAVQFELEKGSQQEIEKLQQEFWNRRKESQPIGEKSAGSVFKRIYTDKEIIFPAKLIDKLGLKGAKIKDAEVSLKHAGFIVNKNNAKAKDVLKLIKKIKRKVKKENNITLEEEIVVFNKKRYGYFWRLPHPHPLQSRNRNGFGKRNCSKGKRP